MTNPNRYDTNYLILIGNDVFYKIATIILLFIGS